MLDLLKASYLGADGATENIGSELEATKVVLARLKKKLAEEKERASHLEEEM